MPNRHGKCSALLLVKLQATAHWKNFLFANAPEGFCIENLVVGPASEHRLCKKTPPTRALLGSSIAG